MNPLPEPGPSTHMASFSTCILCFPQKNVWYPLACLHVCGGLGASRRADVSRRDTPKESATQPTEKGLRWPRGALRT